MRDAAAQEGVTLVPVSGFRSVARQVELIRTKLSAGQPIDAILRYVAAPGFSEHHTGHALDIADRPDSDLDEAFEATAAYTWLARHAETFQFRLSYPRGNSHGIGYEPWHWCWLAAQ
jgi:D-alanyl-D-alanine carboxypeptidase